MLTADGEARRKLADVLAGAPVTIQELGSSYSAYLARPGQTYAEFQALEYGRVLPRVAGAVRHAGVDWGERPLRPQRPQSAGRSAGHAGVAAGRGHAVGYGADG